MIDWDYSNYSKIDAEVKKSFPFKKPRPDQLETISEVKHAIEKGFKYIVLEAGTGTGKSAIAATLSQLFESSYILTVTKQLQDQYLDDFKDLGFKVVKGRSNFWCKAYQDENIKKDCGMGKCLIEGYDCNYSLKNQLNPKKDNTCNYFYQKYLGLNSKTTIANYPYMFLELNYVEEFKKRDLLVCDEAHNLESTIMNQLALEFSKSDLKKYINYDLSDSTVEELFKSKFAWIKFVELIRDKFIKAISNCDVLEDVIYMRNIVSSCNHFLVNIVFDAESWIVDYDKCEGILQFKPYRIDNYAKMNLFNFANVCIFMSATVLDYELFARWLGISVEEIYPIRRKSPFNQLKNPMIRSDKFNLSYANIKVNAPKTLSLLKEILDYHKNDKGIIHTVSSQCMDFILNNIESDRFIAHTSQNRSSQLQKFKTSPDPLVLVSPSMGEGVDLPGDLCRFQIIYKLPRPDWGDRQIKQRVKKDSKWYDYQTCLNLLQAHGRGLRFEDDYCKTYFIDSRLSSYVLYDNVSNHFLPESFKKTIRKYSPKLTKKQLKVKKKLVKKGDNLLESNDFEKAIEYFKDLIKHDLFCDDYYPYLSLMMVYHRACLYEEEVKIILNFFKSQIHCDGEVYGMFKDYLDNLEVMGYYDASAVQSI